MPSIEPYRSGDVPALSTQAMIQRIAADLTPFQHASARRGISRSRTRTAVDLVGLESETVLAEARLVADTKVQATREDAELLLYAKRVDAIERAAQIHDEAAHRLKQMNDDTGHRFFERALAMTSAGYLARVARRSGGRS
jgi:hypothetical protein